jgi:hypothetical protein
LKDIKTWQVVLHVLFEGSRHGTFLKAVFVQSHVFACIVQRTKDGLVFFGVMEHGWSVLQSFNSMSDLH